MQAHRGLVLRCLCWQSRRNLIIAGECPETDTNLQVIFGLQLGGGRPWSAWVRPSLLSCCMQPSDNLLVRTPLATSIRLVPLTQSNLRRAADYNLLVILVARATYWGLIAVAAICLLICRPAVGMAHTLTNVIQMMRSYRTSLACLECHHVDMHTVLTECELYAHL